MCFYDDISSTMSSHHRKELAKLYTPVDEQVEFLKRIKNRLTIFENISDDVDIAVYDIEQKIKQLEGK